MCVNIYLDQPTHPLGLNSFYTPQLFWIETANIEDYDQTALVRSLIRVFPVWKCLKIPCVNFVFTNIVKKKR